MKKKRIGLNKKLFLSKEKISGLNPAQQQEVEGGKEIAGSGAQCQIQISGSGCDCQKATCGIIVCSGAQICDGQDQIQALG